MRKGDSLFSSITFKIILEYLVFPFFSPPKVILILSSYPAADVMFTVQAAQDRPQDPVSPRARGAPTTTRPRSVRQCRLSRDDAEAGSARGKGRVGAAACGAGRLPAPHRECRRRCPDLGLSGLGICRPPVHPGAASPVRCPGI